MLGIAHELGPAHGFLFHPLSLQQPSPRQQLSPPPKGLLTLLLCPVDCCAKILSVGRAVSLLFVCVLVFCLCLALCSVSQRLLVNNDGKQLMAECQYLLGVMLLLMDSELPSLIRERMIISYFRYKVTCCLCRLIVWCSSGRAIYHHLLVSSLTWSSSS